MLRPATRACRPDRRREETSVSDLKIAIIGAGSYVFGPSALNGATFANRLDAAELALVDVDAEALELMGASARGRCC